MTGIGIIVGVLVGLALIIIGYFISTQRSLVNLDEMCKNALSQIEVQLNSRWDALLGLAQTAAQYAKHESETLINVIKQRRGERWVSCWLSVRAIPNSRQITFSSRYRTE